MAVYFKETNIYFLKINKSFLFQNSTKEFVDNALKLKSVKGSWLSSKLTIMTLSRIMSLNIQYIVIWSIQKNEVWTWEKTNFFLNKVRYMKFRKKRNFFSKIHLVGQFLFDYSN